MSQKKIEIVEKQGSKEYEEYKHYKSKKSQATKGSGLVIHKGDKIFAIDNNWFKKWKLFFNKKYFVAKDNGNNQDSYQSGEYPGKINNMSIIYDFKDFYNDTNEKNPDNIILNPQSKYKLITERLWNYLKTTYLGGPEVIFDYNYQIITLTVWLLPLKEDMSKFLNKPEFVRSKIYGNCKSLYVPRTFTVKDVRKRIYNIESGIAKKYNMEPYFNDKNDVLLYTVNSQLNSLIDEIEKQNKIDQFQNTFYPNSISFLFDNKKDFSERPEIEGKLIIIENRQQKYFSENMLTFREGNCSSCRSKVQLPYLCSCEKFAFCSFNCIVKGFKSHFINCNKRCLIEDNIKEGTYSNKGKTGLINLGNSCFLNSSIHCLCSCFEFRNYLINDKFVRDIAINNNLGTQGLLIKALANVLKNVYYGDMKAYSPLNFLLIFNAIQNNLNMFKQEDASDFIMTLLDKVHEDVNSGNGDFSSNINNDNQYESLADEAYNNWKITTRNNKSYIYDLFYGQFRSVLKCSGNCKKTSQSYEPFMSLSLPIVEVNDHEKSINVSGYSDVVHSKVNYSGQKEPFFIKCFYIHHESNIKPIEILIPFYYDSKILTLRSKIADLFNIHPFSFIICQKQENSYFISKIYNHNDLIKRDKDSFNIPINSSTPQGNIVESYMPSDTKGKCFFLYEINPEYFYTEDNIFFKGEDKNKILKYQKRNLEQLALNYTQLFKEEYEENEIIIPEQIKAYETKIYDETLSMFEKYSLYTEKNYGMNTDKYINVKINFATYSTMKINLKEKKLCYLPRIITFEKQMTCLEMHKTIFNYLKPYLIKSDIIKKDKKFENVFTFLELHKNEKQMDDHFITANKYPYLIFISNKNKRSKNECFVCGKKDCLDCPLPFDANMKLFDILEKYPKKNQKQLDNTFYYLSEEMQKQYDNLNYDFELIITIPNLYKIKFFNSINDREITYLNTSFRLPRICKDISIYNCLDGFVDWEELGDNIECSHCHHKVRMKKKMEISKSPHYLIINLKRFKDNRKLENFVEFPIYNFSLGPYVNESFEKNDDKFYNVYDLVAVLEHNTQNGRTDIGHYTCKCKLDLNDNKWYYFDDKKVFTVSEKSVVTKMAYVLIYRRKNLDKILKESY